MDEKNIEPHEILYNLLDEYTELKELCTALRINKIQLKEKLKEKKYHHKKLYKK
ncbi:hypothetical protein AAJ76_300043857 [Vairimorpha ceranae]|uniref:Uncharacterized protein n=1 Tax=Vairimorpha ceranae TaxID=40302 RepID=A0A0F9ZGM6_9MICR|nr:hypothetical protein AAJ76_300043857 [Vairimorpha ceranae]KKO76414.1 hypothetical protein AAJ76_300043857 [Vairimorpha ceranae]